MRVLIAVACLVAGLVLSGCMHTQTFGDDAKAHWDIRPTAQPPY